MLPWGQSCGFATKLKSMKRDGFYVHHLFHKWNTSSKRLKVSLSKSLEKMVETFESVIRRVSCAASTPLFSTLRIWILLHKKIHSILMSNQFMRNHLKLMNSRNISIECPFFVAVAHRCKRKKFNSDGSLPIFCFFFFFLRISRTTIWILIALKHRNAH